MPKSKIDTENPPSTEAPERIHPPTTPDGEPTSPTLGVTMHPLTLGSPPHEATPPAPPPRRGGPSARWTPGSSREHQRGGAKAYGPGRRFNSRHRG